MPKPKRLSICLACCNTGWASVGSASIAPCDCKRGQLPYTFTLLSIAIKNLALDPSSFNEPLSNN